MLTLGSMKPSLGLDVMVFDTSVVPSKPVVSSDIILVGGERVGRESDLILELVVFRGALGVTLERFFPIVALEAEVLFGVFFECLNSVGMMTSAQVTCSFKGIVPSGKSRTKTPSGL